MLRHHEANILRCCVPDANRSINRSSSREGSRRGRSLGYGLPHLSAGAGAIRRRGDVLLQRPVKAAVGEAQRRGGQAEHARKEGSARGRRRDSGSGDDLLLL